MRISLEKAVVSCQYFCRRSFATWDVLLPSKEKAAKVAANNIMTKFFRLQPEYLGTRTLRVTVCNVPAYITGDVLATLLSAFGRVEEINFLRSAAGTAYGDYTFRLCLTREGFQAIPEVIVSREMQMMVVVEGRRPRSWGCMQSFAPGRTSRMLQPPQPQQLSQLLQSPQPPVSRKQHRKRIQVKSV